MLHIPIYVLVPDVQIYLFHITYTVTIYHLAVGLLQQTFSIYKLLDIHF